MKKLIVGLFFIFLCFIVSFGLYLQQKKEIHYAENSSLYQYCEDYYYSNNGNFSYANFLRIIQHKDKKLYTFLQEKKIHFILGKGFILIRSKKTENIIKNSDFSFFEFLFSNSNVLIEEKNYRFYDFNYLYSYRDNLFVKQKEFDIDALTKKYSDLKRCTKIKPINRDNLYQEKSKSAKIVISQERVFFLKSEFNKESQSVIKEVLEDIYSTGSTDTILINLRFFNIEDTKCMDSLVK